MNYHNQPEAEINKRVAEILGAYKEPPYRSNVYVIGDRYVYDDHRGCIHDIHPAYTDGEHTFHVIEKLVSIGHLSIDDTAISLSPYRSATMYKSTEETKKALCILLCEACEVCEGE